MMCTFQWVYYCHDDCHLAPRFNQTRQHTQQHQREGPECIPADTIHNVCGDTYGVFNLVAYMKHQHIKGKRTDGAAQYGGKTASLASFPN